MVQLSPTLHRIARRFGVEFCRYGPLTFSCARRAEILESLKIDLVLDVGAHIGGYGLELRSNGYSGRIVSFEPLSETYKELASVAKRDPAWDCHQVALGDTRGVLALNVSGRASSSSFLPLTATHTQAAPDSPYVGREEVEISTLEQFAKGWQNSPKSIFLKADVQGYEKRVLDGVGSVWPHISALELELSLTSLYAGAPEFEEMLTYVKGLGFVPVSFDNAFVDPRTGFVRQVNAIFLRRAFA